MRHSTMSHDLARRLGLLVAVVAACSPDGPTPSSSAASVSAAASASSAVGAAAPVGPAGSAAAGQASEDEQKALAREAVELAAKGDYAGTVARFSADLAKSVPAASLKDGWTQSTAELGAFQGLTATLREPKSAAIAFRVRAQYERGSVDVRLGFKPGGRELVAMLMTASKAYDPPAYVDLKAFDAADVVVGDLKTGLPGTLVTPKGEGPFPVAVLVHGSGPGDRDESVGPSRPFRDLAEGLASRGVMVLRYEKRTAGHAFDLPVKPDELTLKEEYFDDVTSAIAFVSKAPKADPKRVFVVGHSQGAWLVPAFLTQNLSLAGGVLLSGNARPMLDLLVPQYEFLAKVDDGVIGPLERMKIKEIEGQIARVKGKLDPATPASELPLGVSAAYWLSVLAYDGIATAKRVDKPMLFVQGGRDYQVTEKDDFALWKRELGADKRHTFKLYPKLNHPLIAGEGPMGPAEYQTLGHVDADVIKDVATFLTDTPAAP